MPNIRDDDAYLNGIWDWDILDGCFGNTNIRPTDLDGFVEKNCRFLVLEAKGPGAPIPEGQHLAFKALCGTGLFTVIVVWGPKNQPERLLVMTPEKDYSYDRADLQTFRNVVAWWYERADNVRSN